MVLNPFLNLTPVKNVFYWLKTILTGLVLFLPRLIFFIIFFLIGVGFAKLTVLCVSQESLEQYPLNRPKLKMCVRICARGMLFCLGYHWVTVKRQPNPRLEEVTTTGKQHHRSARAPIMVANHVSLVDAIYMGYANGPTFVGKSEIQDVPLVGAIFKALQCIPVNRTDKESRSKVAKEIVRRAESGVWPPIIIFPEGTTTNQQALISFRPGPFLPGAPVQPVLLRYKYWFTDPSYTGTMSALLGFFFLMCQIHNHLHVTYLPIYYPSDMERKNPKLYASNVRIALSHALGPAKVIPRTNHSYEDVQLQVEALKRRLPAEAINTELERDFPTMNAKCGKLFVERFAKIDKDKNGIVTFEEFRSLLRDSGDEHTQQLATHDAFVRGIFDLLDDDSDCVVNFRDFFVGMALLNLRSELDAEGLKNALTVGFGLLDTNHDNVLSKTELEHAVHLVMPKNSDISILHDVVDRIFTGCDVNGDGQIDLDEFVQYATKNPEVAAALVKAVKGEAHTVEGSVNKVRMYPTKK
eukprot:PhF_6_TR14927/c0_g1_i2/m.23343/K13510/LPCAT1_2; lysophosphatidylcholine acyltransferase / lyso-PAF acetyltransferase